MYLKSICCSILFLVPTFATGNPTIKSNTDNFKAGNANANLAKIASGDGWGDNSATNATEGQGDASLNSRPKAQARGANSPRRRSGFTRVRQYNEGMRRSRFDEMKVREYEAMHGHPRGRSYRRAHNDHYYHDHPGGYYDRQGMYHDSYHMHHRVPVNYMPVTYVPVVNGGCGTAAPCGFGGCNEAPVCTPEVPEERIHVSKDIDDRYEYNGEKLTCTKSCEGTWPYLSGQFGIVTNYVYRGISQSANRPAVQGGLRASQAIDSGFYVGLWGSNVENNNISITGLNGNGLELAYFGGYTYKYNSDLILNIEAKQTTYPRTYYPLNQNAKFTTFVGNNENFDMLEIIPGLTYKWFTALIAIQQSNVRGLTPNLIQRLDPAPAPNGNTKGSLYFYGKATVPVTLDTWNFITKVWIGYWKIRNYSQLSYAHYGVGISYTLPKCYKELVLSLNLEGSSAKRRFYRSLDITQKQINTAGTKLTFGIEKTF